MLGRLASSHAFSMGQRWCRVQHVADVHGLPSWIRINFLFKVWFKVWRKKKKKAESEAISFSLPVFFVQAIPVCMQMQVLQQLRRAVKSCLPQWPRQQHSSGPRDEGGAEAAKGRKCQHLSVTARQMANYHFFSAFLSSRQTKQPSWRLCCLHHFPPPLHLWYANSKTERFCAAQKDLWAHSLGQQSQLLCRGSACCARSPVPRDVPCPSPTLLLFFFY